MPERIKSQADDSLPSTSQKPLASWYAQGLSDGLGDRLLMFDNSSAPSLELLRFRPDFAQVPGFEAALREQVQRLGRFRHAAFAPVRSVQRLEPDDDLALISNFTPGKRLSEVLPRARGPAFASALVRQLAPALALLQQHDAGIAHGVLSADRIVVSPEGRLTIVEHVVGPAMNALNLRPAELTSMGIALPPAPDDAPPRLDVATDWYQLGLVAVSVLIGRPITASELPQLEALLEGVYDAPRRDAAALSPFIRQWLHRALQIAGAPIESGTDARAAVDELLQKERRRDSLRVVSSRHEPAAPSDPSAPTRTDRAAEVTVEAAEARPADEIPARPVAGDDRLPVKPLELFHPEETPIRPAAPAAFEAQKAPEIRQPSPHVRTLFGASLEDARPPKPRRVPEPKAATRTERSVSRRPAISTSVVAALALVAAVEAGIIAVLARALRSAPQSPVVVETAASGGNVLISSRSPEADPLRLAVAPDLRWVRVTSTSGAGGAGAKATTPAGALRISSPIELKVLEASRLLGAVPGADIRIAPGRHELEFVNLALGYRLQQALEIEAGQTVSIHVAPPAGVVTIDASPWAEVTIDGRAAGRTPLGPLALTPGEHDFAFRHPAGLSDRQRVTVKSNEKIRVIGKLHR